MMVGLKLNLKEKQDCNFIFKSNSRIPTSYYSEIDPEIIQEKTEDKIEEKIEEKVVIEEKIIEKVEKNNTNKKMISR